MSEPTKQMQSVSAHYRLLLHSLRALSPLQQVKGLRQLIRTDLYYLLRYTLGRSDMDHPWMLARIREVQNEPDGHLDLWGRDHRKSTVITFGKTLQDILASHGDDPLPQWSRAPTFGIFSHTRPIAKAFLRQIKHELEANSELKALFPDILWDNPERDAPTWSEDSGLVVRRKSNPKEATVEAWGVVDGQPTGKHFDVVVDDDIVTLGSIGSPEMIKKTTDAWALHLNLGTTDMKLRVIGTRYHHADTYRTMIERGSVIPRVRPATDDGTLTGRPVYLTQAQFEKKARDMGPYIASAQLLQNPTIDSAQGFDRNTIRYYDEASNWRAMNRVLLCDPANSKRKKSDWTTMAVLGLGPDENYYLLDFIRDKMKLEERASAFIDLHRKWEKPRAGYEEYGMQADIQHIQSRMAADNYRFDIQPLGGILSKVDRINRLLPVFFATRFYMPHRLMYTQYDKKVVDLIHELIEHEIVSWPVPINDDGLDVLARVFDMNVPWPKSSVTREKTSDRYADRKTRRGTWMSK